MDKSQSQLRNQAAKARQLWGHIRDPYVRQMLTFLVEHWEAQVKSLEREDHIPPTLVSRRARN